MARREIVRFPDPRLRHVAEPVAAFDDSLPALVADLLDTMRAAPGIGITAPHIGVPLRVVVLDLPGDAVRVFVNPEIVELSSRTERHEEGSISMPGVTEEIERPAELKLRYRDVDGREHVETAAGWLAVCLQHEIDQLDGVFWIERLSRLKKERVARRYAKLARR